MMKKIDNIGIVGAGSMGAGIAQVAAMAGYTVYLYDQNKETVKSMRQVCRTYDVRFQLREGRIILIGKSDKLIDAKSVVETLLSSMSGSVNRDNTACNVF